MGCILCNITSCAEFCQGPDLPLKNPFYQKTKRAQKYFLDLLAYDIATNHPEMVRRINRYVRKLKRR